jgi:parallel beta-helix repeat protein
MRIFSLNLLLAVLFLALGASAETVRVNPSKAHQLNDLLARLEAGDTLIFERGVYKIDQPLYLSEVFDVTLRGEGKVEIVLSDLEEPVFSLSACERVRLSGISARHAQPSQEYVCEGAVIQLDNCAQVAISDCSLNGCGAAGVYASHSRELVIVNNTIFNNTFAALWFYQSGAYISGNKIYRNAAELISLGECDITMVNNTIERNQGSENGMSEWARQVLNR